MNWFLVAIVGAVLVIAVLIFLVFRRKETPAAGGVDEVTNGDGHVEAYLKKQEETADKVIDSSKKKITKIEDEAAHVVGQRKEDHDAISGATNWNDLNDIAKDIENRR
ncbi:MAG: hypothetical protein GY841_15765 [FCB group bacterium]|nr:hypothetical protein [FCB group bacterium]